MPWHVGLDEAGYGPNLGPLVLASSACHVPDDAGPCVWSILRKAVRKSSHKADDRLLVDDSKKVNEGKDGLAKLEAGVLAVRGCLSSHRPLTLHSYLSDVALGNSVDDLGTEPWFEPHEPLPAANEHDALALNTSSLAKASEAANLVWGPLRSVVVPAPRFNHLLDEWKLKSGVLATGVIALLGNVLDLPGDDPVYVTVDKLGGRNYYAPLLNEAFGGWVRIVRGTLCCEYVIDGLAREVYVRFEPRADGTHLNVALASMAAKYLHEVCMRQFNRYWLGRVPGIMPTAGYPGDASRFFEEIRNVLKADGVAERAVWRVK